MSVARLWLNDVPGCALAAPFQRHPRNRISGCVVACRPTPAAGPARPTSFVLDTAGNVRVY